AVQRQVEREQLQDRIKTEVNTDYSTWLRNKQRIRVSEQAVSQAEENYRLVNNRFRNNTVLISDLTDANTQLLQARLNLLVDQADAGLSYHKLLQSTASNNNQ
ncbi:MAG TPA: TolC family protein, partial [Puia sp.]